MELPSADIACADPGHRGYGDQNARAELQGKRVGCTMNATKFVHKKLFSGAQRFSFLDQRRFFGAMVSSLLGFCRCVLLEFCERHFLRFYWMGTQDLFEGTFEAFAEGSCRGCPGATLPRIFWREDPEVFLEQRF